MKFLQVNYSRAVSKHDAEQAERLAGAAGQIAQLPGLVWKIWIFDEDARVAGGMYLFDTEESARAWGDGPMVPALSSLPGVSDVTMSYFDVDEELTAVTNGPIERIAG